MINAALFVNYMPMGGLINKAVFPLRFPSSKEIFDVIDDCVKISLAINCIKLDFGDRNAD
jgi:hypothetical protein